jgi:hypothetical protein
MKRTSIYLDEELDRDLRLLAEVQKRAFEDLVREALGQYLARETDGKLPLVSAPRRSIPDEEWRSRMEAVLQRIRAGVPKDVSPEEIEAEITAARAEYRREQAAQQRTGGG